MFFFGIVLLQTGYHREVEMRYGVVRVWRYGLCKSLLGIVKLSEFEVCGNNVVQRHGNRITCVDGAL